MTTEVGIDKSQLPEGAQLSVGSTTKPVGVLTSGLFEDNDVLAYQAVQAARRKRGASVYEQGQDISGEVLQRVKQNAGPGVMGLNAETINQLQQGVLTRDQLYVGNNSQWTGYYLEEGAKFIMPLDTPFKNDLPRIPGKGIDIMNWRTILDVFGGNGPALGNFILQQQGAPQHASYNWGDFNNVFKTLSWGDEITDESELYGQLFEPDMRAKIVSKLIPALMLGQELAYIQGGQNLWAPPVPVVTASTAAGSMTGSTTYWYFVTAVNSNGETLAASTTAQKATLSATGQIILTIFRVPGASSYNVYCGSGSTQPANSAMYLQTPVATYFGGATALNDPGGITPGYFTATMTANPANSGTAYSSVVTAGNTAIQFKSTELKTLGKPLTFDGVLALIYKYAGAGSTMGVGGMTSLVKTVGGPLTQDAIDSHLETAYLNARANPGKMYVGIKDNRTVTKIVSTATAYRVVSNNGPGQGDLTVGFRATRYINPVTGRLIEIEMLPYLPQGTIFFASMELPFPAVEITRPVLRVEYNREMWAREYPPDQGHQTQWQYAAFTNESMACQYMGGQLVLDGITLS